MNAIEHALGCCSNALEIMNTALNGKEGKSIDREIDEAERAMVQARDVLIAELRQVEGDDAASARQVLNQVNSILSWLVGLEYPAAGIQWSVFCDARDALTDLCKSLHSEQDDVESARRTTASPAH